MVASSHVALLSPTVVDWLLESHNQFTSTRNSNFKFLTNPVIVQVKQSAQVQLIKASEFGILDPEKAYVLCKVRICGLGIWNDFVRV